MAAHGFDIVHRLFEFVFKRLVAAAQVKAVVKQHIQLEGMGLARRVFLPPLSDRNFHTEAVQYAADGADRALVFMNSGIAADNVPPLSVL